MNITIDTRDLEQLRKGLARFSDRRFQSALAEAVNKTARSVKDEWSGQLYTRIDRPTRPTRDAAMVKGADVGRLQAEIRLKDQLGSGGSLAPSAYLAPQEFGGDRRVKKFEQALQSRGAMPAGSKVVPGKHAKLDGYGNISRGQIVQVLTQLGGNLSDGYRQVISSNAERRMKSAKRAGRVYLAVPVKKGTLAAGIYERDRQGRLLPVFFFVSRTRYNKRLALEDHGLRIVERELGPRVLKAMDDRLRTLMDREGAAA